MTQFFIPKSNSKNTIFLVVLGTISLGTITLSKTTIAPILGSKEAVTPHPEISETTVQAVTALGRVQPEGEVRRVFPASTTESARIQKLLVKEGDWVKTGQVVAILDNYDRRLAAVRMAQEEVRVAEARLMQVKAGAKQGDLQAQQSEIARLEAALNNAQVEEIRYRNLYKEGAVSASQYDTKRLQLEAAQRYLNQGRAALKSLAEVRPVDVQLSQAEVKQAKAKMAQAIAELDLSIVRSPQGGQVLKVEAFPGEIPGNQGIVSLGNTTQMLVIAEVYETDIRKVHPGQKATITSPSLTKSLSGKVSQIGLEIGNRNVTDPNSTTNLDARVVEVKILLNQESSRRVAAMTNLKVDVSIQLGN